MNNMCQSEDRLGKPSTPLLPPPSTSLISHCACKLIMRTHRIRSTTVGYEKLGTKKVHGEFGKCVIIVILSERYGKCVAEHTTFYVQFQMGKRAHSLTHKHTDTTATKTKTLPNVVEQVLELTIFRYESEFVCGI